MLKMKRKSIDEVALKRKISINEWIQYFVVLIGMTQVMSFLTKLVISIINSVFTYELVNKNIIDSITEDLSPGILILCVVIISPIVEEIIFRKILFERLLPLGTTIAIVVSSLLFGVAHANLEQLLYTIFLGVICANLVIISGKITYAIFMHMMFNFFGGIIAPHLPEEGIITTGLAILFALGGSWILLFRGKRMFAKESYDGYKG